MWTWCPSTYVVQGCRREAVKSTAREVRSQGWNLMELAGAHYKGWMLRFNWIQRPKILPGKTAEWWTAWRAFLTRWEVLYGHRQLVLWSILLTQATGETHASSCYFDFCRGHSRGTARVISRKEWSTVGLYEPNFLGYTRHTMVKTMGC